MSLAEEQAEIYPQLASALIEATPEWWTQATLVLECPDGGFGDGLTHTIFNEEFPQDVVVATDEIMIATRMLELTSKRHSDSWKRCVFRIHQDVENWRFAADYER